MITILLIAIEAMLMFLVFLLCDLNKNLGQLYKNNEFWMSNINDAIRRAHPKAFMNDGAKTEIKYDLRKKSKW